MAVGGARGIAVGAAAAAAVVVTGCGGSNPDTSQDQLPREPAIGAAATGNPRSRQEKQPGFCKEERRREQVGGGGGERREPPAGASILSIASRRRGRRTGARNFSAFAFRFVASPCSVGPPRLMGSWWNRGKLFGIGFCSFLGGFEIDGPTGGEQKSEVVKGVTVGRTRVSLLIV